MPAFPPGTILNEVFSGWRSPRVVDRVEPNEDAPLEYAKIWRLAQARTSKPVRFGTVSAQTLSIFLELGAGHYREDERQALIWDMAEAMNIELRSVADAGCKAIQVEDPLLHYVACYQPENTELIDFLVSVFNREIQGLENVEVWAHTCWGNPNMQRGMIGSYANSLEILLERINADVVTIECRDDNGSELELFEPYRSSLTKKVAIGAVSHRTLQVESPADVAELTMRAIAAIGVENLILSSDCGFGRQGANRLIAFYKAAAIAQGANLVRRQLCLPERDVPCAVPEMQPDVVTTPTSRWFGGVVRS
jgi:5-methyltetrahydropteroyltriglutamate--homocysteine methyltransferase